jgi:hypothetical protein
MRLFSVARIRADVGTGDVKVTETKKAGIHGSLKIVLLVYNGGLDTSISVPWLRSGSVCTFK